MPPSPKDGEYGRVRLWGAVGWGGLSTLSGWLLDVMGMRWGFLASVVLALPAVALSWHLDLGQGAGRPAQELQLVRAKREGFRTILAGVG